MKDAGAQKPDDGPLSGRLAEDLRQLIVSGSLRPGQWLREDELCAQFAVSRTPLREAIRQLSAEGIVTLKPRAGASVAAPDLDEILETFFVIGALDARAGALAATLMTDADIAELDRLHLAMLVRADAGDLIGYHRLNQRIHARIAEGSGNAVLARELARLNLRVQPYRYAINVAPADLQRSLADHERIMAALHDRDAKRLARILEAHLPSRSNVIRARAALDAA